MSKQELSALLDDAKEKASLGNLVAAKRLLVRLIEQFPDHCEGNYLLGLLLLNEGNHKEAEHYFIKAIDLDENNSTARFNLAQVYLAQDRVQESLDVVRMINSNDYENYHVLMLETIAQVKLKKYQEAISILDRLLAGNAEKALLLGMKAEILMLDEQIGLALKCYDDALTVEPRNIKIHLNRGALLIKLDRNQEAIESFQNCLDLDKNYIDALDNQSIALAKLGRYQEALDGYDQALRIIGDQSCPVALNKCALLINLGHYQEALRIVDGALQTNNKLLEAWVLKGLIMNQQHDFTNSCKCYSTVISQDPENISAWFGIGNNYRDERRLDEAIAAYTKVLEIDPKHHDAKLNRALLYLAKGEFNIGFKEYESRWNQSYASKARYQETKLLDDLTQLKPGNKITVWGEQGFGDIIQFSRYLPMLVNKGCHVEFEVPRELKSLFLSSDFFSKVDFVIKGKRDFQIPLLSLPKLFGTEIKTIPNQIPYLNPSIEKQRLWEKKLYRNRRAVGLVWRGGRRKDNLEFEKINNKRNIPFEEFSRMQDLSDIDFYCLHIDDDENLVKEVWKKNNYFKLLNNEASFEDTAGLIKCLDLVITVDTAVAHLAGALGVEVWILSRINPCWRWLQNTERSPWYPSARIYGQEEIGNWSKVIDKVIDHLSDKFY